MSESCYRNKNDSKKTASLKHPSWVTMTNSRNLLRSINRLQNPISRGLGQTLLLLCSSGDFSPTFRLLDWCLLFPGVWFVSKSSLHYVWVRSESRPSFIYTLSSGLCKFGQIQRLPKTILNGLLSILTGLSYRMECFTFPQSSGSEPSNALTL